MKEINYKFVLSNIITALILFFSVPYYRNSYSEFHESGAKPVYGTIVIVLVLIGMIATSIKASNIACESKNHVKWHGRLFLIVLYICSFIANMSLLGSAINMIGISLKDPGIVLFYILSMVVGFISLIAESHFLQHRPTKLIFEKHQKKINWISGIYSSLGVSLCWNHLVVAGGIHFSPGIVSVITCIVLMFIFVFPFQRLFWYELVSNSESRIDNLKTVGAIALVFVCGIAPIFLS